MNDADWARNANHEYRYTGRLYGEPADRPERFNECVDLDRRIGYPIDMKVLYSLQYGYWGFRINGSALQSYPTKQEAIDAYYCITGMCISQ